MVKTSCCAAASRPQVHPLPDRPGARPLSARPAPRAKLAKGSALEIPPDLAPDHTHSVAPTNASDTSNWQVLQPLWDGCWRQTSRLRGRAHRQTPKIRIRAAIQILSRGPSDIPSPLLSRLANRPFCRCHPVTMTDYGSPYLQSCRLLSMRYDTSQKGNTSAFP